MFGLFLVQAMAKIDKLRNTTFDFHDGMACDFHFEDSLVVSRCSFVNVRRQAYLFLDLLNRRLDLKLKMQPGFHYPRDLYNKYQSYQPEKRDGPDHSTVKPTFVTSRVEPKPEPGRGRGLVRPSNL
jgi:hypothetical protein